VETLWITIQVERIKEFVVCYEFSVQLSWLSKQKNWFYDIEQFLDQLVMRSSCIIDSFKDSPDTFITCFQFILVVNGKLIDIN